MNMESNNLSVESGSKGTSPESSSVSLETPQQWLSRICELQKTNNSLVEEVRSKQNLARKKATAAKKASLLRSSTMMCSTSISPALRVFSDSSRASKEDIRETYANQAMQMENLKDMNRKYASKARSRASREQSRGQCGFGFVDRGGGGSAVEKVEAKIEEEEDEEEEAEEMEEMERSLVSARALSATNEALTACCAAPSRTLQFKAPPRPAKSDSIFSFSGGGGGGTSIFSKFGFGGIPPGPATASTENSPRSSSSPRGFSFGAPTQSYMHDDSDDDYDEALVGDDSSANAEEATTARDALQEIEQLLDQLKVEPTDSEELANKFQLFEKLQETTASARESVLAFWEENKDEFDSSTASAAKIMDKLDKGTGIVDDDRVWFVYHMTKQCHINNLNIMKIFSQLKKLLTALQEEVECDCPICFEPLAKENRMVLMCSHATCKSCWSQWNMLQHNKATCPLCRNREFAEQLVETERRFTPRFFDV